MIFCGLIGNNIDAEICPLKKGKCMWQHREDQHCCYSFEKMSKEEYCNLVGLLEVPSDEELEQRQLNLQNLLTEDKNDEDPTLDT